ncbi:lipoyl synthase [Thiohalophilus sp.]|uniref:lipoyl synthase n=1 Tax=Thiohalophilus sp. TaxID=3028392 RepID=UPI002ACD83A5|nr:lipoyl synthase [Thiohalophilus sp.]MDZ7661990.1 lipoyl synthase [Thiohalophilus sp.]
MSNKVIPVFDFSHEPNAGRMPQWIRQPLGNHVNYSHTARNVHSNTLHTVCEEARCPNRGECWSQGTATFMLLGDTCTRACGFCAVKTGRPGWFDDQEPERIATAVRNMGLDYVVLTSVNRDDMDDGGATIYAETVKALRRDKPAIGVELLTPDFHRCQEQSIEIMNAALREAVHPTSELQMVWGHNVETVPSLYKQVRKGSSYERSLEMLRLAALQPGVEAKSAIMLGLGESREEVLQVLRDLREVGVSRIAIGQYLRPSRYHLAVKRYLSPAEFDDYGKQARALGFGWVKAGPMVRSSYHAEEIQN